MVEATGEVTPPPRAVVVDVERPSSWTMRWRILTLALICRCRERRGRQLLAADGLEAQGASCDMHGRSLEAQVKALLGPQSGS